MKERHSSCLLRLSDLGPCCRRPSLPQWGWLRPRGRRLDFLPIVQTKRKPGNPDVHVLSQDHKRCYWKAGLHHPQRDSEQSSLEGQALCPTQTLCWFSVDFQLDLIAKSEPLNRFTLSDAAEIPWESSSFFRSRAACALRLVLVINHLFLTLSARPWYAHSSGSKANKPCWKPMHSLHLFQLLVCSSVMNGVCMLFNHLSSRSLSPLLLVILIYCYHATHQKYFYFLTSTCVCSQEQLLMSVVSAC